MGAVAGILANLALLGFYLLARPWVAGTSAWDWLGPANDVTGAVSMAALIPLVAYLDRALPTGRLQRALGICSILGMAGLACVTPLMLYGVVSLTVQFAVAGVALPPIFGWLLVVNRVGRRTEEFPASVATFGERVGLAALAATGIAGVALLLPGGSITQYVIFGVAAVVGLPAYLAFPVWPLLLARKVLRSQDGRLPTGSTV